jgi:hypothetical protein
MVESILRWSAVIGAVFKKPTDSRARRPASNIAAETLASSGVGAGAVVTATASVAVTSTAPVRLDHQEIQRRRELVRTLFNDFWSGREDKPAAFVDRLDQAESYLNEQLAACGESWQLDAQTRKTLRLPPRSNSRTGRNDSAVASE